MKTVTKFRSDSSLKGYKYVLVFSFVYVSE